MHENCRNYYKTSREAAGFTQEEASEILGISTRTLSGYENWYVTPDDEIVEKMAAIYHTKLLGWWHLRTTSSLARACLPELQYPQSYADIYVQIDFAEDDIHELKKAIKGLLVNGKFTPDGLEKFKRIQETAKITGGKLMSVYTYEPTAGS